MFRHIHMGKRRKSTTKPDSEADHASAPPLTYVVIIPDGCEEASHDPELQAMILKVCDRHNASKYRREQRKRARQTA